MFVMYRLGVDDGEYVVGVRQDATTFNAGCGSLFDDITDSVDCQRRPSSPSVAMARENVDVEAP